MSKEASFERKITERTIKSYMSQNIGVIFVLLFVLIFMISKIGFSLIPVWANFIALVLIGVLAFFTIKSFDSSLKPQLILFVSVASFILTILFFYKPYLLAILLITSTALLPQLFIAWRNWPIRIIVLFYYAISLFVGLTVIFILLTAEILGDFGKTTVFKAATSPNKQYRLVGIEYDEGALGGNVSVSVERKWLGLIEFKRILYYGRWGRRPVMEWIDERTVNISGREMDIYFDLAWHDR